MPANTIPDIELKEGLKEKIGIFLREELDQALEDRKDVEELWTEIQEFYEKTTLDSKKNWPFDNAAYLMIPVMATYIEQIHAKIQNTIWAPSDPFSSHPSIKELSEYTKSIRRWLTWASSEELHLKKANASLLLEFLKLGGMVAKVVYTEQSSSIYKYDELTKEYQEITETFKDSPDVLHVPLIDFIFPTYSRSLEEAPWKAHRFRLSWNEMLRRGASGAYDWKAVQEIKEWYETRPNDYEQERADLSRSNSRYMQEYELFEVWFEYIIDVDDDLNPRPKKLPKRLVATFHRESQKLLRIQHNWYPLQLDPFEFAPYIARENQVLGIGVGQMALPFQKEISTMHNQRLDNATIANIKGYKYKADGSTPQNMKLHPGIGVPVDEMDDFQPFDLGSPYNSTITEEEHTIKFLQQRIGMHDYMPEMSGGNATTVLAMMQESTRRFDSVVDVVRDFNSRVITKVILLYQAYYPTEKLVSALGEDGVRVAEVLEALSPKQLYDGMGIQVTATTSATSKDMERQNKLALFNLLVQYYGQLTQYLMAISNPQVPPAAREGLLAIIDGLSEFVKEILEDFNIRGRTDFTVDLERLQSASNAAAATAPQNPPQEPGMGGNGGPPAAPAQASGIGS